jgi:A/G-specific adenine glycosylase
LKKDFFWSSLLEWFHINGRNFPWRESTDPFHILIAEILLQQTHVRKVQKIYEHIVAEYPTPDLLAEADLPTLEKIIQPIGLKYRSIRLKRCAEIISLEHCGKVPNSREELMMLPGVGYYIADAVLCYAFGQPTVPIDTNVIRVFCRFFGFQSSKKRPRTDSELTAKIRSLFCLYAPTKSTKIFNLAVLDFGGLICKKIKPAGRDCPLNSQCSRKCI